jgi:hypothetical protein
VSEHDVEWVKRRVDALVERWVQPSGLGWWKVHVNYHDGPWERTPIRGVALDAHCLMDVSVDWRYMEASIRVDCVACADLKDSELEYAFVHELMHIFVREMRVPLDRDHDVQRHVMDEQLEHEERVCTTLAKGFIWVREAALEGRAGSKEGERGEKAMAGP